MTPRYRDDGYDDLLEAIEAGHGFYLACENGHNYLPPRRVCPDCGSSELEETPLPGTGEVITRKVVHVPPPRFEDDAPYVTAVAEFGPVRVTGIVLDADAAPDVGGAVRPVVGSPETRDDRLLAFEPV
ncbi:nucleic acid-binding protein [Halobacteriales archaeon QS_5_70_15]|nr:MAG: nucleic acid-binding protein [Halobacteriales archaeon QS_5_70_15]